MFSLGPTADSAAERNWDPQAEETFRISSLSASQSIGDTFPERIPAPLTSLVLPQHLLKVIIHNGNRGPTTSVQPVLMELE